MGVDDADGSGFGVGDGVGVGVGVGAFVGTGTIVGGAVGSVVVVTIGLIAPDWVSGGKGAQGIGVGSVEVRLGRPSGEEKPHGIGVGNVAVEGTGRTAARLRGVPLGAGLARATRRSARAAAGVAATASAQASAALAPIRVVDDLIASAIPTTTASKNRLAASPRERGTSSTAGDAGDIGAQGAVPSSDAQR